jgi:uncharacterized protein (TIGR03083 family)
MIQKPPPVLVVDRFPALLTALLELLGSLSPEEWGRQTVAAGWTVHDVALYLLGDDLGILSAQRDAFVESHAELRNWEELVAWLNRRNESWVEATRRISPRLVCDLLRLTGEQVNVYFATLDPEALGGPVSWAGPEPAPVWLDLAREFTERWHHQQHIRDAVGKPGLTEPYYLAPVLATFVRALPQAYRQTAAEEGTAVTLTIVGNSGASWSVVREGERWQLYLGKPEQPRAEVMLPEDVTWRLWTKGMAKQSAREQAVFHGDQALGERMLEAVSIIA